MLRYSIREIMGLVVIAAVACLIGRVAIRADNREEFAAVFALFVFGAACYGAGLFLGRIGKRVLQ
jgi:hypothetical protein